MTVHLVGAGPGDPDLLTCRAANLLRSADFVVHDRLVGRGVLRLSSTAVRVDVGKRVGESWRQEAINELLVDLGRTGAEVVRLKCGDPFVFGRGWEEAAALARAGVDYSVVPGLTSAIAAPAVAGLALTARGRSSGFTVVSGRREAGAPPPDWTSLARLMAEGHTVVVLMGVARRAEIADFLRRAGARSEVPVAVIGDATLPTQRMTRATLGTLATAEVHPPAVIVIGEAADAADAEGMLSGLARVP